MCKKECNRKYYACNSEQLKTRGMSLYKEDPGKKKAAAASLYSIALSYQTLSCMLLLMEGPPRVMLCGILW